ncbi:hypothetical protein LC613_33780 [Nostoc sphaeroides CHAB 2801]|uniref:type IV toxin-antitoxin system AbiEi family antitoxin n=1 Tax=Nostoc sphaeroides TaxID=446679 RepID=UPI001E515616|nr:type IV toxin-antitoxin system AbiEi family antitoxin [Nostoc sphaeroides]MCC5632584.1 hypothetical protein [Nostoc sphaeroides CHAB 2801]
MQPKHPWLQKCLQHLENLPQIKTTTIIEPYFGNAIADGLLTIFTLEHEIKYVVEIKSPITLETLDSVIEYWSHLKKGIDNNQRPLLVTDTLSDSVINLLLEKNIEFIDTTGNIYLNNSSVYILVRSNLNQTKKAFSGTKITPSTLKVAYVILQNPSILKYPEEIAEIAGVDSKTSKRSLKFLFELDYLQRQRGDEYRIASYTKLLERWELGYAENLHNELLIDTFTPIGDKKLFEISNNLLETAETSQILIGGELGAALLTDYLQPISAVLHVPQQENSRLITTKLRLKPDRKGSITIVKQFGTQNKFKDHKNKCVVDPLLIHAELALNPDERIKETAYRIYKKYIAEREMNAEMKYNE